MSNAPAVLALVEQWIEEDRRCSMVPWGWLIPASILSTLCGAWVMAMCAAAARDDEHDSDLCEWCRIINWGECRCPFIRERHRRRAIEQAAK